MRNFTRVYQASTLLLFSILLDVVPSHADMVQDKLMELILNEDTAQITNFMHEHSGKYNLNLASTEPRFIGWTPFFLACGLGQVGTINEFLLQGVAIDQSATFKNKSVTPFLIASMHKQQAVLNLLVSRFSKKDFDREIQIANEWNQPKLVKQLLIEKELKFPGTNSVNGPDPMEIDAGSCNVNQTHSNPLWQIQRVAKEVYQDVCEVCLGDFGTQGEPNQVGSVALTDCGHCYCELCIRSWGTQLAGHKKPLECPKCNSVGISYSTVNSPPHFSWVDYEWVVPTNIPNGSSQNTKRIRKPLEKMLLPAAPIPPIFHGYLTYENPVTKGPYSGGFLTGLLQKEGPNGSLTGEIAEMEHAEYIERCLKLNPVSVRDQLRQMLEQEHSIERGCFPLSLPYLQTMKAAREHSGSNNFLPFPSNDRQLWMSTLQNTPAQAAAHMNFAYVFRSDNGKFGGIWIDDEQEAGLCRCVGKAWPETPMSH